jgi:hypothetical protein
MLRYTSLIRRERWAAYGASAYRRANSADESAEMRVVRPSSHQRNAMEAMLLPMNTTATKPATIGMSVDGSFVPRSSEIAASTPLSGSLPVTSCVSGTIAATPSVSSAARMSEMTTVDATHAPGRAPAISSRRRN